MYIGVDYYPEHWTQSRWETDAKLMQAAGLNIVRMAEFAWVDMEPQEGVFQFDWLDQALETLGKHGISAILGTPTAAMPAWLAQRYPEVMAMEKNGQRTVWGVRKNNCLSVATYRRLSQAVTRAMAEHFTRNKNVVGWQTDNEFGGPVCYCSACRAEFQAWLNRRYGSLEALNQAWGAHFWGQQYSAWAEVQLPTDDSSYNPSLLLDWKRFNSWLNVRFQAEQVKILREMCPQHFVTHNLMGLYPDLNYYDLAEDLDFVSWDNYPVSGAPGVPISAAAAADLMRGLKRKNFWIMETTAGSPGWGIMGRNPRPGEIHKVALQQIAHGADGLLWFRWRTSTAGREQYWHGLLGHDGLPLRRYREAAATASELHHLADELKDTTIQARVALVYDYDSSWAFNFQPAYSGGPAEGGWGGNYLNALQRYYQALFRAGVNVDMIPVTADFGPYKAVFAPHLHLLPDEAALRLVDYVDCGGVLLADCRTAVKNETNLCYERTLPGMLSEPLGITIEEYEALAPGMDYGLVGSPDLPGNFTAQYFSDWVTLRGAESLVTYQPWHMQSFAAVTRHRFGQGWGYYAGTLVKEETFYDALVADVLAKAKVKPILNPPAGVEISLRQNEERQLLFIINHNEHEQSLSVPAGVKELISGQMTGTELVLPRFLASLF